MVKQRVAPAVTGESRLRMGYQAFLDRTEENVHAEWVDGEVTVFMPPSELHQDVVGFLYVLLAWYARRFDLGKVLLAPFEMKILGGRVSREPDLLFVAREHAGRRTGRRIEGPADLVIEVVSDDSARRDRREKFRDYQAAGVLEYWIVDPRPGERRASFYRLGDDGQYVEVPTDAGGRRRTLPRDHASRFLARSVVAVG